MCAASLGMPFHTKSYEFGNLFVTFEVKFPKNVDPALFSDINKALSDQVEEQTKTNKN